MDDDLRRTSVEVGPKIGIDLGKAGDADGIGTWQRQMVRASRARLGQASADNAGKGAPEIVALDAVAMDEGRNASTAERDIDIFVSSAWTVPPFYCGPLIYVVHDLTFLTHPELHTHDNLLLCTEGILRARLTTNTHFVCVSQATQGELWRILGQVPSTVIANGVDPRWRPLPEVEVAQRLTQSFATHFGCLAPEPEGVPEYVLFVGSFEPRKNLERLHQAHGRLDEEVRRRHPLVVAGAHGWHLEDVRRRMEEDPYVALLGRVDDDQLLDLYNGATLFVYPSRVEGFGLPVVEAMACGAPVLTSNVSSLPEVAGEAAALVDPEDLEALSTTLSALLASPAERRRLAALGPPRASRFSWSAAAEQLLDLVDSILLRSPS